MKPIYLDFNAITPIAPEVADTMRPFLNMHIGNPSSAHIYGTVTKKTIEDARSKIAGLRVACEHVMQDLQKNRSLYNETKDIGQHQIQGTIPESIIIGHPIKKHPNTLNLSFPKIKTNNLVSFMKQIVISLGDMFHSGGIAVSIIPEAMNIPPKVAIGSIRISTGRNNSLIKMKFTAREIISAVKLLSQGNSLHR